MALAAVILAFVIWGVNSTLVLRLLPVSGPFATFCGAAVAAAISWLTLGRAGRAAAVPLVRAHPWRTLAQVCAFAGTSLTYQTAVKSTTVANAALTHALMPVFACLLIEPLLGRRPTRREAFAVVLGLAGMAVLLYPQLSLPDADGDWFGIWMGTLSAVFYAWSMVNQARFPAGARRDVLLAVVCTGALAVLAPFAVLTAPASVDARGVGLLLLFGLLGFYLANRLYLFSLRKVDVTVVSTLSYVEPVVSLAVAALWLAEPLTPNALAGGAMILGSSALIVFQPSQKALAPE